MTRDPQSQRGFTLIELMIALTLFSIAVAGILSVAVTVTQGYREQRQVVAAESSVRAPLEFLSDAIRQASPGVSDWSKVQDFHTCVTGAITVTDSSTGPDELDLFYASGGVLTSTTTPFVSSSGTVGVTDASKLSVDDYVLVTDLTAGILFKIAFKSSNVLTLAPKCSMTLTAFPVSGFAAGALVIRAQHAHFAVSQIDGAPTLTMDPDGLAAGGGGVLAAEPLAEGIEDIQIALGVESNSTIGLQEVGASANDDEWYYNVAGETAPPTTAIIRAVRITLIAQTKKPLVGNTTTFFNRPKAENHAVGAADNLRRRVLTTTVELRNISGSP